MLKKIICPPKCGICGKLNANYLCRQCEKKLQREAIWEIKQNKNPYIFYNELIAIFSYAENVRKYIIQYKFEEKSYLYKTFVNFLIKNEKIFKKIQNYDIIVPVPISRKRKKQRGYNQSSLIAKEISQRANIALVENCIYKTKNTIEQSKLNYEQRQKNAQDVYTIKNKQILENRKILLLDDIYTTGSTINSCSEIIQKARPQKIGAFVIAKD